MSSASTVMTGTVSSRRRLLASECTKTSSSTSARKFPRPDVLHLVEGARVEAVPHDRDEREDEPEAERHHGGQHEQVGPQHRRRGELRGRGRPPALPWRQPAGRGDVCVTARPRRCSSSPRPGSASATSPTALRKVSTASATEPPLVMTCPAGEVAVPVDRRRQVVLQPDGAVGGVEVPHLLAEVVLDAGRAGTACPRGRSPSPRTSSSGSSARAGTSGTARPPSCSSTTR